MDFVAIDFELANESYDSACACGVALVQDGKLQATQHWLIRPPELRFGWYQTNVLKIDESAFVDRPRLCDLWPEIQSFLGGRLAVAHSAGFDMSVLSRSLSHYGIDSPTLDYSCTCRIAQATWDGLPNYQLATLAKMLGLVFQHHHAGEDARVCAEIALASIKHHSVASLEDWESQTGVYRYQWSGCYERMPQEPRQPRARFSKPKVPLKDIRPTVTEFDEAHPFFGRMIVFTGTLTSYVTETDAAQEVVNRGGRCKDGVCKKTDYLIRGEFDPPKTSSGNLDKAAQYGIRVIDEDTFVRMLSG